MIRLSDTLWIGDSSVGQRELWSSRIGAALNVAQDLRADIGWPDVEYMQVGLIDGPGNPLGAYYSAVLALDSLLLRRNTLVFCHTGSRSMAVGAIYLNAKAGLKWDELIALLRERVDGDLPSPHKAHREAFDRIDWKLLEKILRR